MFSILVQIANFDSLTQVSTKSQPFVLMLSIVSAEVGQLIFLGILIYFFANLVLFN